MRTILRPLIALLSLAATAVLPGCTTAQMQQDEAYILQLVASAKAGAKIAASTASAAVDLVCGYVPIIVNDFGATQSAVGMTGLVPGPKTSAALDAANKALASASSLCAAKATAGIPAKIAAVWDAYSKAKAAIAAAKTAGGA